MICGSGSSACSWQQATSATANWHSSHSGRVDQAAPVQHLISRQLAAGMEPLRQPGPPLACQRQLKLSSSAFSLE